MYNQKVLQHFRNPKNCGRIDKPDGVGKVGNVVCGDVMWLYIKVRKNKKGQEIVGDVKFETFGCVAAIATSSMITDLAKWKPLNKAWQITRDKIAQSLGGLPPIKLHCSLLAADALSEAIYDYLTKKNKKIPEELQQRHIRISKEKRIIEEKYRDWIKTEERIHRNIPEKKHKN